MRPPNPSVSPLPSYAVRPGYVARPMPPMTEMVRSIWQWWTGRGPTPTLREMVRDEKLVEAMAKELADAEAKAKIEAVKAAESKTKR